MMMDKTIKNTPLARIVVDTPFCKGDNYANIVLTGFNK